jgi:phosphoglycerate dehydrogenase-like enzyme
MDTVLVGIHSPLDEDTRGRISALSDRLSVAYLSPLIAAERKGDDAADGRLDGLLAATEILYGFLPQLPRRLRARAPKLRWIQAMSAGVDTLPEEIRNSPVVVTNVSGIHAVPIAEFILQYMLMFAKRAPLCFQLKQEQRYERFFPETLTGKTAGIIGLGSIGRETARLAKSFHMRVLASHRTAKPGEKARYVDEVLTRAELPHLLEACDFVVLAVPLTAETAKLIGPEELRLMRREAYLINIARGGVVDEAALIQALEEHTIAGAALDVFATEPLPRESRLWDLPNVIFSPHVSGTMPDYTARTTDVFCENLTRYLAGKRLLHRVNTARGY